MIENGRKAAQNATRARGIWGIFMGKAARQLTFVFAEWEMAGRGFAKGWRNW